MQRHVANGIRNAYKKSKERQIFLQEKFKCPPIQVNICYVIFYFFFLQHQSQLKCNKSVHRQCKYTNICTYIYNYKHVFLRILKHIFFDKNTAVYFLA